jgi:cobyrinic acid a,c-diamide synthase
LIKHAILIAGTHSGVGKTTITTALMAACRRRGMAVQGFKVGPDFIDPGFHTIATGRPSRNLDGWMLDKLTNIEIFETASADADIAIIEGVMGLFDGASATDEAGSTAEMAKLLNVPVLLVIDASAQARSAAAIVHGFESFDRALNVSAVIANHVGGQGHYSYVKEAIQHSCKAQPVGYLPDNTNAILPSRHLGLVTAEEVVDTDYLNWLADWIEATVDLDKLLEFSKFNIRRSSDDRLSDGARIFSNKRQTEVYPTSNLKIGIARDSAFCFYYQDNLDLLQSLDAELVYWSPIDEPVPYGLNGLYFGGGYPELYAEQLAANTLSKQSVRSFITAGGPVYAECGGLMFLTEAIVDLNEVEHQMAGVIPTKSRMQKGLAALGYTEVSGVDCELLPPGESARGHQFRYSYIDAVPLEIKREYEIKGRMGASQAEGFRIRNCLASYVHLHFLSNPLFAKRWLSLCKTAGVLT